MLIAGCSNSVDTTVDAIPLYELKNEKGAMGAYNAALIAFNSAFTNALIQTAIFTDELESSELGLNESSIGATGNPVDARTLNNDFSGDPAGYRQLHFVRSQGSYAAAALEHYAPSRSLAMRGHLAALQGYAVLLLADIFCSGVPLSKVDFEEDFTYKAGSTTDVLYAHSIQLFDSAIALSQDSIHFLNLALVGKARAWLALGRYDSAKYSAAMVDSGFSYQVTVRGDSANRLNAYFITATTAGISRASVGNGEGINGLQFVASGDPRSATTFLGNNSFGKATYRPSKFPPGNTFTATVGNWMEARLIVAEHALRSGNVQEWLDTLNILRASLKSSSGNSLLPPLVDPDSAGLRFDLMFNERAYWLFLTGHRQGDLRRRVRNDGLPADRVYPSGPYYGGAGMYGSSVNFPIPQEERRNPLFEGCRGRDA